MRNETLQDVKEATESDDDLRTLTTLLRQGWPDKNTKVPSKIRSCFIFRGELIAQNGLVYKGERVVVPTSVRQKVREELHFSHRGIQGTLRKAREAIYWPGMNKDITGVSRCSTCNTYKCQQQKEPLISHELPSRT